MLNTSSNFHSRLLWSLVVLHIFIHKFLWLVFINFSSQLILINKLSRRNVEKKLKMASEGESTSPSLQDTPVWALAIVCFIFIYLSIFIEYLIHLLSNVSKPKLTIDLHKGIVYNMVCNLIDELSCF